MGERRTFVLKDRTTRHNIAKIVDALPLGTRIEIKDRSRTDDQNRALWGLLNQIQRQRPTHNGVQMTADTWKSVFLHALGVEANFLPTLDGQGLFPAGQRSSQLTKSEFADLLELMLSWAAREGLTIKHFGDEAPQHEAAA